MKVRMKEEKRRKGKKRKWNGRRNTEPRKM